MSSKVSGLLTYKTQQSGLEAEWPWVANDPWEVSNHPEQFKSYFLIGPNWKKEESKPIIIIWGINTWKFGFVSEYFSEYRTAFAPRKHMSYTLLKSISVLKNDQVHAFVIWGKTEPTLIRVCATLTNTPIWRIEDGFLRSANLGVTKSTPLSLCIDKNGIYYDQSSNSDLIKIFNNYDFSSDQDLKNSSEKCFDLWKHLQLSKYNSKKPKNKIEIGYLLQKRKRVAIIGQVSNDSSLKYGNPDKWTDEALVMLAAYENPGAHIVYRPHPDYNHIRSKRRMFSRKMEKICTVESSEQTIPDFLQEVDHIYTITSLVGLEAILREKKVTTVGTPFYAGLGLSDDRCKKVIKKRKLNRIQLFAAVYLLYPTYLNGGLAKNIQNFYAAAYKISARRELSTIEPLHTKLRQLAQNSTAKNHPNQPKFIQEDGSLIDAKLTRSITWNQIFNSVKGSQSNFHLAIFIIHLADNDETKDEMLRNIEPYLSAVQFSDLLSLSQGATRSPYIYKYLFSLISKYEGASSAKYYTNKLKHGFTLATERKKELIDTDGDEFILNDTAAHMTDKLKLDIESQNLIDAKEFDHISINSLIENHAYCSALERLNLMLRSGYGDQICLSNAAHIYFHTFDKLSAQHMTRLLVKLYGDLVTKRDLVNLVSSLELNEAHSEESFFLELCVCLEIDPSIVAACEAALLRELNDTSAKSYIKILRRTLKLDGKISRNKIMALLDIGEEKTALEILEHFPFEIFGKYYCSLAIEVLIENERLYDALNLANILRVQQPSYHSYRENLKVLILLGNFHEALEIIREAESKNIDVGEMYKRKVLFDLGFIEDAFKLYQQSNYHQTLIDYFGVKYFDKHISCAEDLLILPIYGPGDELRWASIYNDLYNLLPKHSWQIGCDPRFEKLFNRSMPNISFVPIQRLRGTEKIMEATHDQLPGRFLINVLDNDGFNLVRKRNQIALVSDFLPLVRKTKSDFNGSSYLTTNPDRSYRQMLTEKFPEKILVGINWRSSLFGRNRDQHYLSIDMLLPLFALDGVQFVNLQYDECSEELSLVNSTFPGKIWNDEQLDQRNDLDGVAALMDGLDLVIAPCTSVLELAGAIGKRAWLISISPEMNWRKVDFDKDLWFESVEHIQGNTASNKSGIVETLTSRLQHLIIESQNNG